jgi:cupin 2 domain-containing protein
MIAAGNLYAEIPEASPVEQVSNLLSSAHARIERIVSYGQASPPDFWYDQDDDEWVIVLAGSAGLLIEGEASPRQLGPGDYVHLPAHVRHRVEWTAPERPTVWLAVHVR